MKSFSAIVLVFLSLSVITMTSASSGSIAEAVQKSVCPNLEPQCVCSFTGEIECNNFKDFNELTFQGVPGPINYQFTFVRLRPNIPLPIRYTLKFEWFKVLAGSELILANVNEIDLSANPFQDTNRFQTLKIENTLFSVKFDRDSPDCSLDRFGPQRRFMTNFDVIEFSGDKNQFNNPICPLFFKNAQIQSISFDSVSDNNFPKFDTTVITNVGCVVKRLEIRSGTITSLSSYFINPVVFGNLETLVISNINLSRIDANFFPTFANLSYITISAQDLGSIFIDDSDSGYLLWIESLNSVSKDLEIVLIDEFGRYDYDDNSTFCLFKKYPQTGLVRTEIYNIAQKIECTCTYVWLVKSSNKPLNCTSKKSLQEWIEDCNFDNMIYECDPTTTPPTTTIPITTTTTPIPPEPKPKLSEPIELYIILVIGLVISLFIMVLSLIFLKNGALFNKRAEPRITDSLFKTDPTIRRQLLKEHKIEFDDSNSSNFPGFTDHHQKDHELIRQIEIFSNLRLVEHVPKPTMRWLSPVLYDPESHPTGLFVDFRSLNSVIRKEFPVLVDLNESIRLLQQASYYSTIDLSAGVTPDSFNHKIALSNDSKDLTTFKDPNDVYYQYRVVPFGLCNYRVTVKKVIEKVLKDEINRTCILDFYVDPDNRLENRCRLIICGETPENHRENLIIILHRFKQNGVVFDKTTLEVRPTQTINFVNRKITGSRQPTMRNFPNITIRNFEKRLTFESLDFLRNLISVFHDRIANHANLDSSLARIEKPKFERNPRGAEADIHAVVQALDEQMVYPQESGKKLYVYVTASSRFYLAILAQSPDQNTLSVVSNIFKELPRDPVQRPEEEIKLNALFWALREFHDIIFNKPFTLRFHYDARFESTINSNNAQPKVIAKRLQLEEYDYQHNIDNELDDLFQVCENFSQLIKSCQAPGAD